MNAGELLRLSPEPAVLTDADGRVLAWNEALVAAFGLPAGEPTPHLKIAQLLHIEDVFGNPYTWPAEGFAAQLEQGHVQWPFEVDVRGADGRAVRAVCAVVIFVSAFGATQVAVFFRRRSRRRASDLALDWLLRHPEAAPFPRDLGAGREGAGAGAEGAGLTSREREVLRHLAAGLDNPAIARTLGISVHTVRSHVQNLLRKLDVHSQLEAVSVALRSGMV